MTYGLDEFIREALAAKIPKQEIKTALLAADWKAEEVDAALGAFADVDFPIPVPRRRPYLSAREAFLYLLLFLCLYLSAWSFGSLIFKFVGRTFPDLLRQYESVSLSDLRLSVSMLLIAFPVYLWMTQITSGEMRRDPDKRGSKIRKWLTYITLFVAAGVIIGDLITLFFNLLEGELTVRFILKVVTVLYIAGLIFGYYLWELRREEAGKKPGNGGKEDAARPVRRAFLGLALISVLAALISGFFIGGSPSRERERKLDDQRLSALQQIASTVEAAFNERGVLPATLDELTRGANYYLPPLTDPKTGQSYEYRLLSDTSYELCAVFDRATQPNDQNQPSYARPYPAPGYGVPSWDHPAGRHCFSITPQKYPRPPESPLIPTAK